MQAQTGSTESCAVGRRARKERPQKWEVPEIGKTLAYPLDTTPTKIRGNDKVKAIVSTSVYFNKNGPKKFKKEIISKQPSYKNVLDGKKKNSLNKFIQQKESLRPRTGLKFNKDLMRNSSTTKISKIEFQIKKHCLKKKKLKTMEKKISAPAHFKSRSNQKELENLKTDFCIPTQKEEERETSNTSSTSQKLLGGLNQDTDHSFLYADIDLGDKKESGKGEERVIQKMNIKTNKVFASNFYKINEVTRNYGCSCGPATDSNLDCCVKAEQWLKYAFLGSSKSFGDKDRKVFQELIDTDVKKESKIISEGDERIPITACIENDLKRTFPHEEYYQSSEAKANLFNVLKAYTLYDNKCGYVQGMNFIAASLLYHSSPEIAFWIFVSLIFDYHLRDNYEAGFPGVEKINEEIKALLTKIPKLNKIFAKTETDLGMFTLEIIMSLFGIALPLSCSGEFYDNFFKNGWNFFCKLIIAFLEEIKEPLLKLEDPWEIIRVIKAHTNPHQPKYMEDFQIKIKQVNWECMIEKARNME